MKKYFLIILLVSVFLCSFGISQEYKEIKVDRSEYTSVIEVSRTNVKTAEISFQKVLDAIFFIGRIVLLIGTKLIEIMDALLGDDPPAETHTCELYDGNYYGSSGSLVSYSEYYSQCVSSGTGYTEYDEPPQEIDYSGSTPVCATTVSSGRNSSQAYYDCGYDTSNTLRSGTTIEYTEFSTTNPSGSQHVYFVVSLYNVKGYSYRYEIYTGTNKTKTSTCSSLDSTNFYDSFDLYPPKNNNNRTVRYLVYNNSNCSGSLVTYKDTNNIYWDSSSVTISYSGFSNSKPALNEDITFTTYINNAYGKYYKYYTYTNDIQANTPKCRLIDSNSFVDPFNLSGASNNGDVRYARYEVYSDKSCQSLITSKETQRVTWGTGETPYATNQALTAAVNKKLANQIDYTGHGYTYEKLSTLRNYSCSYYYSNFDEYSADKRQIVACIALAQVNRVYMDCWDFVTYIGKVAGVSWKDYSSTSNGKPISQCQMGDRIVYKDSSGTHKHSGIYISPTISVDANMSYSSYGKYLFSYSSGNPCCGKTDEYKPPLSSSWVRGGYSTALCYSLN